MDSEIKINFLEKISSKKAITVLLLILLLIVFWDPIWREFDDVVIEPLFSKVKQHWTLDILHIAIVFFTVILTFYYFINNNKVSTDAFLTSTILFFIYVYWRFITNHYNFVSLTFIPYHKHVDLAILFFVCVCLLKVNNWVKPYREPKDFKKPFLVDKPISEAEKDIFGRKKFAKEIAYKIQSKLDVDAAGAVAVGINGVWGSGKTSFTNLIRCFIDHDNRIVIDFNPWSSTSHPKIIEDFFEQLVSEMAKYDPKLSKNISEYAKTLTSINENAITKGMNTLSEFLLNSTSKSYDEINSAIGNLKKQVIIFIDDLDRLDKKEIIEVLRLIRNTANFNNVIYIVSYDKDYVEEAIHKFNPYNYKSFLEKIFQFEFTLPKYEKAILRRNLKDILNEKLGDKSGTMIESAVEARTTTGRSFTNEIVRTQRDVIRLANSFIFEFSLSEDEVHFVDFYLLQLLKLKHQNIYEYLYKYQNLFFISETRNFISEIRISKSYLRLRKNSERHQDDEFSDAFRLSEEDRTLDSPGSNSKDDNKIQENNIIFHDFLETTVENSFDRDIIKDLIDELLKEKRFDERSDNLELYKSFAYPGNFHKFFSLQLLNTDLPAREFEIARKGKYEHYKHKTFEWIKEGKLSEINDRFDKINDFTTIEEFENHLKISIDVGRFRKENGESSYGLNYWQIVRTLKYPINKNDTFIFFDSKESYQEYLKLFFSNAPSPYIFESNIIVTLMSHQKDFVLSNEELTEININYFKEYCNENKAVTRAFIELYRNCIELNDNPNKTLKIAHEAPEIFKTHFKSYLKSCELSGFILHSYPVGNYFQIHVNWVKEIFNSVQEFETYLKTSNNLDKDECYTEFVDFYDQSKDNLFSRVEYNFKHLTPERYN